jgi:carboxylesterase
MVRKILSKAKSILLADPKLLYEEEINLIKKDFYFPGKNGKAVILFHGWSTTPYEVRRLGQFLNEKGYSVYGPMFSGHGTVPEDLEDLEYIDWLTDAKKAILEMREDHDKIFIGGTSMGANITMCLAKEEEGIDGIILMAAPYRMKFEMPLEMMVWVISLFKKYHKKFYPPTFGLSTTITRLISYQRYPIKNVLELGKLVKRSRKDLKKIHQPCLILQSAHDHIVTKNSLEKIYKKISSKHKRKKYIQKAYHTFISDIKNEHVFEDIWEFLEDIK